MHLACSCCPDIHASHAALWHVGYLAAWLSHPAHHCQPRQQLLSAASTARTPTEARPFKLRLCGRQALSGRNASSQLHPPLRLWSLQAWRVRGRTEGADTWRSSKICHRGACSPPLQSLAETVPCATLPVPRLLPTQTCALRCAIVSSLGALRPTASATGSPGSRHRRRFAPLSGRAAVLRWPARAMYELTPPMQNGNRFTHFGLGQQAQHIGFWTASRCRW